MEQENMIKNEICGLDNDNVIVSELKIVSYNSPINLMCWVVRKNDDLFIYETHYAIEETNMYHDFEIINIERDFVIRKRKVNKKDYREVNELLNKVKEESINFDILDGVMCSINTFNKGYKPVKFNSLQYPKNHPNNQFVNIIMRNIIDNMDE